MSQDFLIAKIFLQAKIFFSPITFVFFFFFFTMKVQIDIYVRNRKDMKVYLIRMI